MGQAGSGGPVFCGGVDSDRQFRGPGLLLLTLRPDIAPRLLTSCSLRPSSVKWAFIAVGVWVIFMYGGKSILLWRACSEADFGFVGAASPLAISMML